MTKSSLQPQREQALQDSLPCKVSQREETQMGGGVGDGTGRDTGVPGLASQKGRGREVCAARASSAAERCVGRRSHWKGRLTPHGGHRVPTDERSQEKERERDTSSFGRQAAVPFRAFSEESRGRGTRLYIAERFRSHVWKKQHSD